MLNIGPRLECVASMVESRTKIVDIGTDHAYLPAFLVLNGKAEDVLACDIGIMPLKNAEKTVNFYSLNDKITLRVSDGLNEVSPEEAKEITICGMGGTLMSEILSRAEWIKREGMHLILQPMTHSEDVRQFLCQNGFVITEEKCVIDNKKVYCCISAHYTGEKLVNDDGFYYFGYLPPQDEVSAEYVSKQLHRLNKKLDALLDSGTKNAETDRLSRIRKYYEKRMSQ